MNKALRSHDRELYAVERGERVYVLRKGYRMRPYSFNGGTLLVSERDDHQILALTDNWLAKGTPVDWGTLPLMAKIREMDAYNDSHDGGILARLEKQDELHDERAARKRRALHEEMAYEHHSTFRKAFKDINTAGFNMKSAPKGN